MTALEAPLEGCSGLEALAENVLAAVSTAHEDSSQQRKLFASAIEDMMLPICRVSLAGEALLHTRYCIGNFQCSNLKGTACKS